MKTKIIEEIIKSKELFNRLILIVGQCNCGKTSLIREIGEELNLVIINVNLELSRSLLNMSNKERMMHAQTVFNTIIEKNSIQGGVVLLDNLEILFDCALKIDPIKVLIDLSRYYCVVATLNGNLEDESIIYGQIGHKEYRKYSAKELLIFHMNKKTYPEIY